MRKTLKLLGIFYFILAIAWVMTEYKEPKEAAEPKVVRRKLPKEKPYDFPGDYSDTHKEMAGVFGNSTGMFTNDNIPVLVLPPFTMATDDSTPHLLNLVTESAYSYLYNDRKVRIVRRDYTSDSRSRIRAKYILIGRVSTIGNQVRISVRIQDINTGEILDAFDGYIDKAKVNKYL